MTTFERNKRLTATDRDTVAKQLAADYNGGASLQDLADRMGTSAGRVRGLLLEAGVTLRARGGATRKPNADRDAARSDQASRVAAGYADGKTLDELGQEHGVSASTARGLVLRGGGTLRARGGRGRRAAPAS